MRRSIHLAVATAILLAACQGASTATTAPSMGSASPAAAASTSPTPAPTLPVSVPRPSSVPTDGSCEDENTSCLGVLTAGTTYKSKVWKPTMTFSVPTGDWVNRWDTGGDFGLLSTASPGDSIVFFREPRADDKTVGPTVEEIAAWLVANKNLTATSPVPANIGGLTGLSVDVQAAPGATVTDPGCPVQVCVPLLRGDDPTLNNPYQWHWDWGLGGTEKQRLYLLPFAGGTIAISVDSLDGLTFDELTEAFDEIAPTIKLD